MQWLNEDDLNVFLYFNMLLRWKNVLTASSLEFRKRVARKVQEPNNTLDIGRTNDNRQSTLKKSIIGKKTL